MTALSDLEAMARKATPGPWMFFHDETALDDGDSVHVTEVCTAAGRLLQMDGSCDLENAQFIAAMDPQVALALMRVAQAAIRHLKSAQQSDNCHWAYMAEPIEELETALRGAA